MSEQYTYDSTGWLCENCNYAIDEYGCQSSMKNGEPVCINCCWCPDHTD